LTAGEDTVNCRLNSSLVGEHGGDVPIRTNQPGFAGTCAQYGVVEAELIQADHPVWGGRVQPS
jgi:hypothetical protein